MAAAVETSVEALQSLAHKTQLDVVFLLFGQNQGAQRRCQGQCHKGGEQDARCHGDGELAVEHSLGSSHKRHGDEHRRHHQRDGNDGSAYLFHRLLRGFHRREFVAQHLHIHRFNHHNRVVHHNTDGHHQGEERNHIERDVEHHHRYETPQQRDGDGQNRNHRSAPIAQEHKHHDGHQHKGFEEGVNHLFDACIQEAAHVVAHLVVHAFGHIFLQSRHGGFHLANDVARIAAVGLFQGHSG